MWVYGFIARYACVLKFSLELIKYSIGTPNFKALFHKNILIAFYKYKNNDKTNVVHEYSTRYSANINIHIFKYHGSFGGEICSFVAIYLYMIPNINNRNNKSNFKLYLKNINFNNIDIFNNKYRLIWRTLCQTTLLQITLIAIYYYSFFFFKVYIFLNYGFIMFY